VIRIQEELHDERPDAPQDPLPTGAPS